MTDRLPWNEGAASASEHWHWPKQQQESVSDCVLNTVFTEVGCFSAIVTDSNKWLFQTLKYWVHHVCYVPLSSHWLDYGFRLFTRHRRDVCSVNKWPLAQCNETVTSRVPLSFPLWSIAVSGLLWHNNHRTPDLAQALNTPIGSMAHSLPVLSSSKFSIYISV